MSWIYIIAVIIFAIFSSLGKAGKNNGGGTQGKGGMPTFGGNPGRESDARKAARDRDGGGGSGFPSPGAEPQTPWMSEGSSDYDTEPPFRGSPGRPSPDYETGEGVSMEHPPEADSTEIRAERMRRELERVNREFDRISAQVPEFGDKGSEPRAGAAKRNSRSSQQAASNDVVRGLIWSEILGPPRSREPHRSSRTR